MDNSLAHNSGRNSPLVVSAGNGHSWTRMVSMPSGSSSRSYLRPDAIRRDDDSAAPAHLQFVQWAIADWPMFFLIRNGTRSGAPRKMRQTGPPERADDLWAVLLSAWLVAAFSRAPAAFARQILSVEGLASRYVRLARYMCLRQQHHRTGRSSLNPATWAARIGKRVQYAVDWPQYRVGHLQAARDGGAL